MNAHTKGPWSWDVSDHSLAMLLGPEGLKDHVMSVSPCKSCIESADPQVWEFGRCTTPTEANARLIACAPELFELALLIHYRAMGEVPDGRNIVEMAKALVAKVEGKP